LKQSILLVEDEKEIADTLNYALNSEGFDAIWVSNIEDALIAINDRHIDLGIFDIGLPDGNGFELLKKVRQSNEQLPVMFLTARSEEIDRVLGLEIGADDYVVKPFSPREVVARVKAILKRSERRPLLEKASTKTFEHREQRRSIEYHGTALDLTRAEYQLMATLLSRPGQVFARRTLIEHIWSSNHPSDDRAIDTHVKTLRAKLKTLNPHTDFIVTHRGFGYSLELS
jgi:two-component system catabolic regulation response regulator CreB